MIAAVLPRCLWNFKTIGKVQIRISRLRDFARSCGKTSVRLVNRGPVDKCDRILAAEIWHKNLAWRMIFRAFSYPQHNFFYKKYIGDTPCWWTDVNNFYNFCFALFFRCFWVVVFFLFCFCFCFCSFVVLGFCCCCFGLVILCAFSYDTF